MATVQQYKERIASTSSLKKIFKAQELIAASRISKARGFAENARPFAETVTKALTSLAAHIDIEHPLITPREKPTRAAVLVVAADRGMAGAYTVQVIRAAGELIARLQQENKSVEIFAAGRRVVSYYKFRGIEVSGEWEGDSDAPHPELATEIADKLVARYLDENADNAVDEVYIVYTNFINMVSQKVKIVRMLPIEIVKDDENGSATHPLYTFEPDVGTVLDALLPRYFRSRVHQCLLDAAASETASRQRAMHTATENAEDLIKTLTVKSNQARQAKITSELSEIVGSADALAKKA
ncbi:MAG: F0F1 ATP synthase subunit gamma [Bifidobacteriaceae bacterium]|jgi:F-type H+-transporting ATPase subunit gamma|nr:F0F1 ATP synthase subunit gamma [Bifidobacteriaceae bacterium]